MLADKQSNWKKQSERDYWKNYRSSERVSHWDLLLPWSDEASKQEKMSSNNTGNNNNAGTAGKPTKAQLLGSEYTDEIVELDEDSDEDHDYTLLEKEC